MSVYIKDMAMPIDCLGCRITLCDRESYLGNGRPKDCPLEDAGGMISRAELFNKLATVNAPMEANAYKAEVYRIINEMGEEKP